MLPTKSITNPNCQARMQNSSHQLKRQFHVILPEDCEFSYSCIPLSTLVAPYVGQDPPVGSTYKGIFK